MTPELAVLLAGIFGALIGALGALIVAVLNRSEAKEAREEEREERFADEVRGLAGELLRGAAKHQREVRSEVRWRVGHENAPWELAKKPGVGSTEPLYATQAELHVTVHKPATASAAYALYAATVALDQWSFTPRDHLIDEEHVRPLLQEEWLAYVDLEGTYFDAVEAFIAAVRDELGRDPFVGLRPVV